MLTRTTEDGIRALLYLVLRRSEVPVPPRVIAEELELSPSYLAKIAAQLVKADILRARRGVKGGVSLSRAPAETTLLMIIEALQGRIVGRYCEDTLGVAQVCAFHDVMHEVHAATVKILSGWTLADLAARPVGTRKPGRPVTCVMRCLAGIAARPPSR